MDIRIASVFLQLNTQLSSLTGAQRTSSPLSTASLGGMGATSAASTIESSSKVSLSKQDDTGLTQLAAAFRNRQELYTAQLSALGSYRQEIGEIGQHASKLQDLGADATNADVKTAVTDFMARFNEMVKNQAPNFADGATFDDLAPATSARFAMERDIEDGGNGSAKMGYGGLGLVGISIDPETRMMKMDEAKFDAALASNGEGVKQAVKDLGTKLKSSTDVYTDDNKFVGNRMRRLQDAITFIDQRLPGIEAQIQQQQNSPMGISPERMAQLSPSAREAVRAYHANSGY